MIPELHAETLTALTNMKCSKLGEPVPFGATPIAWLELDNLGWIGPKGGLTTKGSAKRELMVIDGLI